MRYSAAFTRWEEHFPNMAILDRRLGQWWDKTENKMVPFGHINYNGENSQFRKMFFEIKDALKYFPKREFWDVPFLLMKRFISEYDTGSEYLKDHQFYHYTDDEILNIMNVAKDHHYDFNGWLLECANPKMIGEIIHTAVEYTAKNIVPCTPEAYIVFRRKNVCYIGDKNMNEMSPDDIFISNVWESDADYYVVTVSSPYQSSIIGCMCYHGYPKLFKIPLYMIDDTDNETQGVSESFT